MAVISLVTMLVQVGTLGNNMKNILLLGVILCAMSFVGCENSDTVTQVNLQTKSEVVVYKNTPSHPEDLFEVVTDKDNLVRINSKTLVRILRPSGSGLSEVDKDIDSIRTGDIIEFEYDELVTDFSKREYIATKVNIY